MLVTRRLSALRWNPFFAESPVSAPPSLRRSCDVQQYDELSFLRCASPRTARILMRLAGYNNPSCHSWRHLCQELTAAHAAPNFTSCDPRWYRPPYGHDPLPLRPRPQQQRSLLALLSDGCPPPPAPGQAPRSPEPHLRPRAWRSGSGQAPLTARLRENGHTPKGETQQQSCA